MKHLEDPAVGTTYAASAAQRRLWFIARMHPESHAYHNAYTIRFTGTLAPEALAQALRAIVARHEPLRTRFAACGDDAVVALVSPHVRLDVPLVDLRAAPPSDRERLAQEHAHAFARARFDLERGPLLRVALVQLADDRWSLILVVHHVVFDRWSFGVFMNELAAGYRAGVDGSAVALALARPAVRYAEILPDHDAIERDLAYWRAELVDVPALELPTDLARPPVPSRRGAVHESGLTAELVAAVAAVGQAHGATAFMTYLAAFCVLVQRYSGQDDFVVGLPVAGRTRVEVEPLIGLFVNTLPLRVRVAADEPFDILLAAVRARVLALLAHQAAPLDRLVQGTLEARNTSREPLFDVAFNYHNTPYGVAWPAGLDVQVDDLDLGVARLDLVLTIRPAADGTALCRFEYATDLFTAGTVARIAEQFGVLLSAIVAAPATPAGELPLESAAEADRYLTRRPVAAAPHETPSDNGDSTLPALFERRARLQPDAPALAGDDGERLSYRQCEHRANRLAHALRARGAGRGVTVGLLLERSIDAVVAMLAVLKAGGAYVPLDPRYPAERTRVMLDAAGVRVVVARHAGDAAASAFGRIVVAVDDGDHATPQTPPESDTRPDDAAYILFTSGSSGLPKGVLVEHRSVVALLRDAPAPANADDVWLLHAALTFDASVFDIWSTLAAGATLAIAPAAPVSLAEFGALLLRHGVTRLDLSAALLHQLVDERLPDLHGLRYLIAGGDVLSPAHVARFIRTVPTCRFFNGYGPTECTVFATVHEVDRDAPARRTVPIGQPLASGRAYVLDARGVPAATGVPGELYLGGDGVARGYVNDPELTAQRFVPDPFAGRPRARMLRTGDRARRLADGSLEFLGRLDAQVKIRGFRIEPAEIEFALLDHPGIRRTAVTTRQPASTDDRILVAYVETGDPGLDEPALRAYVQTKLPAHMVPARIVVLASMPMTTSGKIDRARLPSPDAATTVDDGAASPVEGRVAQIFGTLLNGASPGRHDDFFAIGGHSLLATRAIARLADAFGVELSLRAFFTAPTVAGVAALLGEASLAPALSESEVDAMLADLLSAEPVLRARFRCVLIGESPLVLRCADLLLRAGHEIVALAVPDTLDTAAAATLPATARMSGAAGLAGVLAAGDVDYLFSIVNAVPIGADVLARTRHGGINVHDALLPRYAGRNAPTWAILNGETTHGVTWHRMSATIDGGAVLEQRSVTVEQHETALSLNLKCFDAALASFAELLDGLERNAAMAREQDLTERTWFARRRRPSPACIVAWDGPAVAADRFARALDFGSSANPIGSSRMLLGDRAYRLRRVVVESEASGDRRPGTVVRIDAGGIAVTTRDYVVTVPELADSDAWQPAAAIARRHGLAPGMSLPGLSATAELVALDDRATAHEPSWLQRLATVTPVVPAHFAATPAAQTHAARTPVAGVTSASGREAENALLTAFAIALAAGAAGASIGFIPAAALDRPTWLADIFATELPLAVADVRASRDRLEADGPYALDVFVRYPELRPTALAATAGRFPIVAVVAPLGAVTVVPGVRRLTFVVASGGTQAELMHADDTATTRAAETLARRIGAAGSSLGAGR